MNYEYLDHLPLTEAEKLKIMSLGIPSAVALRATITASPEAFVNLLGKMQTRRLTQALDAQLSEDEKSLARTRVRKLPATGAIVSRMAPALSTPQYDLQLRDRLFNELQSLKNQASSDGTLVARQPQIRRKINDLERQINALLETA